MSDEWEKAPFLMRWCCPWWGKAELEEERQMFVVPCLGWILKGSGYAHPSQSRGTGKRRQPVPLYLGKAQGSGMTLVPNTNMAIQVVMVPCSMDAGKPCKRFSEHLLSIGHRKCSWTGQGRLGGWLREPLRRPCGWERRSHYWTSDPSLEGREEVWQMEGNSEDHVPLCLRHLAPTEEGHEI